MEYVFSLNYGDSQIATTEVNHLEFRLHPEYESICRVTIDDEDSELYNLCSTWVKNNDFPPINEIVLTRKKDGVVVYRSNFWKKIVEAFSNFHEGGFEHMLMFSYNPPVSASEEE